MVAELTLRRSVYRWTTRPLTGGYVLRRYRGRKSLTGISSSVSSASAWSTSSRAHTHTPTLFNELLQFTMLPTTNTTPANLKQYTKDIPPGWRPRAYPLKEYRENLLIWSRLTKLDTDQAGAAIMSRLEGQALKRAKNLKIIRLNLDTRT